MAFQKVVLHNLALFKLAPTCDTHSKRVETFEILRDDVDPTKHRVIVACQGQNATVDVVITNMSTTAQGHAFSGTGKPLFNGPGAQVITAGVAGT